MKITSNEAYSELCQTIKMEGFAKIAAENDEFKVGTQSFIGAAEYWNYHKLTILKLKPIFSALNYKNILTN